MPVDFNCGECQAHYEVSNELAGRTVKCRECGTRSRAGAAPPPRRVRATLADDTPRAVDQDEPAYFADALRIASLTYQMVSFLVSVGVLGCAVLLVAGIVTGHGVEAFVVVALAGIQLFFAVLGSRLVVGLTQVFVGLGRDIRTMRRGTGRE